MTQSQIIRTESLNRALESAVAQSWSELMPLSAPSQVHIEYQTGGNGALELLRIWTSTTRGYWDLICEMWFQALWSHNVGLRFANGFHSPVLADALSQATRDAGANSFLPSQRNLIQINPSSQEHNIDTVGLEITATAA